jgi:hypothetical protein
MSEQATSAGPEAGVALLAASPATDPSPAPQAAAVAASSARTVASTALLVREAPAGRFRADGSMGP